MQIKSAFFSILILLTSFIGIHASDIPPHLRDVRQLQENVLQADNSYRHSDSVVEWKGYNGASKYICHTDCSGLIDALLAHSYHFTKQNLLEWLGRAHAKSRDYFRVINDEKGFVHIHKVDEIQLGDFVAMKFLPWAEDAGHDTGHIMVINELPRKIGDRSIEGVDLVEWAVEVIDASHHGHGKTDTRYHQGRYWPGIGKGVAALFSNADGIVVGYTWTPNEASVFWGQGERPLVIGRIKASFK